MGRTDPVAPGRVADYTVLCYPILADLCTEVRVWIAKGWEPLGAVSAYPDGYCYQAMIKREEK